MSTFRHTRFLHNSVVVRLAVAVLVSTVVPWAADGQTASPAAASVTTPIDTSADAPPGEPGVALRFLRDVGTDYKNFFSKDTAVWLGIGGGAALAVHTVDDSIAEAVQEHGETTLAGGATYGSQWVQVPVAIGWWTVAAAAGSERHAAAGRDLLRAQIAAVSWTYAIKLATDRTRPNGDPHSFPSGHASTSFATAMVLQEHYGWKVGLPAFLAAGYTGVSRVTENHHWASDVVFGAALGIVSGRTVTVRLRKTRLSLAPLAVPGGEAVVLTTVTGR